MTNICFVPPIELSKSASSIPWGRLGQQNPAQNKENAKILVSSHSLTWYHRIQIWFARLHRAFADSWTIRRIDADDDDDNHHDVDADDDDNADDADEDADYWERAPLSPPTLSWKHGVGPTLVLIMPRPTLQSNSIWVYLICTIWTYIWPYFFLFLFLCKYSFYHCRH